MKIILEPADTAGQKQVALGLQASGLAEVIELDFGGNGGRRLHFNFEDEARKKDVMAYFVEMHAKGLILHTKKDLVRFLAAATNLGSIAAIRQSVTTTLSVVTVRLSRPPESVPGAHCRHHNAHSIGICYEGGLDIRGQPADTRTEAQKTALRSLLRRLHAAYPRAIIVGHHDLNPQKPCPCIPNVAQEYAEFQPR